MIVKSAIEPMGDRSFFWVNSFVHNRISARLSLTPRLHRKHGSDIQNPPPPAPLLFFQVTGVEVEVNARFKSAGVAVGNLR